MRNIQTESCQFVSFRTSPGCCSKRPWVNLGRRGTALEDAQGDITGTLKWVVANLGRMPAVQHVHTRRLERLETRPEKIETRLENKLGSTTSKASSTPCRMPSPR
jgi:hypothetical protein